MALILKKKKTPPSTVSEGEKPAPKKLVLKKKPTHVTTPIQMYAPSKPASMVNCDGVFDAACTKTNSPAYVSYYLMASYLYYQHDVSLLSDAKYDDICKILLARIHKIEHRHKHLISLEMLRAGTGYALDFENFPLMTISAAIRLANELLGADIGPVVVRR